MSMYVCVTKSKHLKVTFAMLIETEFHILKET